MELGVGIVVVLALGYGVLRLLQSRAKERADQQARAEKRAKSDRADAKAFQRSLDGRR